MEKRRDDIWYVQEHRWTRAYAVHPKGWAMALVFVVMFFAIAAFFISLNPFQPLNYGLLFLWWLSVIAMMAVNHLLASPKTERRWQRKTTDTRR